MRDRIAAFVREQAYRPMTSAELTEALKVPPAQARQVEAALGKLEAEGLLVRTRTGRYGPPEKMNLAVGRLQGHPRGFAFVVPEVQPANVTGDIFIGRENISGALHGDRVVVRLTPPAREGARSEGEVIRILDRAVKRLVGTFEGNRTGGYVVPDDPRLPEDVVIPRGQTNGAKPGEKVVIRLTSHPGPRRPAEGQVVERLGPREAAGVDILSIVRAHDLPETFPPKVLREAEEIPEAIPPAEYDRRVDLRQLPIVTIDGEDAKDLDDAVCVQKKGADRWKLWVSIADVGYYVREGSPLDREALRRGTSVYLAGRVIPMLPPRLSDHLCSLGPGVDRLTVTCEMEIDRQGKVVSHQIYPSVIRSAARLTYGQVAGLLEGADPDAAARLGALAPVLREMQALMQVLRERRSRRGSLDFDLPEAKLVLGDGGRALDVQRVQRTVADRIIEEFMLVANETVAEHYSRMKVPFIYRVHEPPPPEKAAALAEFLQLFGYAFRPDPRGVTPQQLREVTEWAAPRPEAALVETVVLRSMQQARYSHENPGHFGLAAPHYCHFTSPIRRYPDLVVHRIIREVWERKGNLAGKRRSRLEALVREAAGQSSVRERVAVEAERETYNLKKAEFMQSRVGELAPGVISGVTPFGFFVQMPNTVEGLVHVSTLDDDYYLFEESLYALVGQRTGRSFRPGDPVEVRVTGVDLPRRSVDLALVAAPAAASRAAARTPAVRPQPAEQPAAVARPPRVQPAAQEQQQPARGEQQAGAKQQPAQEKQPPADGAGAEAAPGRTVRRRRRRKPEAAGARPAGAEPAAAGAPAATAAQAATTAQAAAAARAATTAEAATAARAATTAQAAATAPAAAKDAPAVKDAPAAKDAAAAKDAPAARAEPGKSRKPARGKQARATEPKQQQKPAPAERARSTDMWGVPVRSDRPRGYDDEPEQGGVPVFSLKPGTERSASPARRDGGASRRGPGKPGAEK